MRQGAGVHFDTLETRDPGEREQELRAQLPRQIAYARTHSPYFAGMLATVDPATITTRATLAALPVTRKSDLSSLQKERPPFGGLVAAGWGRDQVRRAFASPGPIYEPEGFAADYWRLARALYAAGFRPGDLIHNSFSYHCTPAGSMLETGAHALGCAVFPGGTGQTEQQVHAMAQLQPDGYVGTPSFLKIILDKAAELGVAVASVRKALVSGEAFPASARDALLERGVIAYQAYASADLGSIAYESEAREGLIVDEGVLLEIVRPGTGDPVPTGEVGEVVVTLLANTAYPVVRFGTGDLSALLPGASPCGRTNLRIRGWLGRADQTAKVKGMFVHPGQIAEVARRHPSIARFRLVIDTAEGGDRMTLHVEGSDEMNDAIAASLREITRLRGAVIACAAGTLPNDGKLIDDQRRYD